MAGPGWTPDALHVNQSAHELHAADPSFGVEPEWCASIRTDDGEVIGHGLGRDADAAIATARRLASWPALYAALETLITPGESVLGEYAAGDCYCDEPDESAGESGTIVCTECRAREAVRGVKAALRAARGEGEES